MSLTATPPKRPNCTHINKTLFTHNHLIMYPRDPPPPNRPNIHKLMQIRCTPRHRKTTAEDVFSTAIPGTCMMWLCATG